jgi:hypothetical protein
MTNTNGENMAGHENATREDEWNTNWSDEGEFRLEDTEGGKIVAGLLADVVNLFDVPNEWLPESYRTTGTHRSLASVEKQYNRKQAKRAEQQTKAEYEAAKARNVERYAEQFEELVERDESGTFVRIAEEFDRSEIEHDDNGKYRWEMAFVKAAEMEIE